MGRLKKLLPVTCVCILRGSIYLSSKIKKLLPPCCLELGEINSQYLLLGPARGRAHKSPSMHLSKESATESCVISFRITLLLRLPFIFESMCRGVLRAAVALLVEGTDDENYFSIVFR